MVDVENQPPNTTPQAIAEDAPIEVKVRAMITQLEQLDRTYFGKDRVKKVREIIDQATALLDTKPIELVQNKKEKADLLYLRGRALDFLPEYTKQAEDLLSKSLKLIPTKREAWDALGHVYWKKNDLVASKNCFESSLEQEPNNREILRNLSMVYRKQQTDNAEVKKANFAKSIALANKACSLDMRDSQSWYVLGNAHFTNFFECNEDIEQLNLALRAYAQTERQMQEPNPDLFFNRATILEYLERYGEAVRDYNLAHQIDPNLQANAKAGAIIDFVVQTSSVVQSRQASRAKKNVDLARSIPTRIEGELRFPVAEEQKQAVTYAFAPVANLSNGINNGAILPAKIVMHLQRPTEVPQSFLIVDSAQNFSVASFYHTNNTIKDVLKVGDLVYIKNPQLIATSLEFKGRRYSYNCIKVAQLTDVLINGEPITDAQSQNVVVSSNFS